LDVVEEVCTNGPCVWVLEDLHWADGSTWGFVKHATRRVGELPVVLIATYREEEVGFAHAWWQRLVSGGGHPAVEAVQLARLTDDEVAVMVALLAPTLSAQTIRNVVVRSAGTPLFVEELVALAGPSGGTLPALPEIVRVTFQDRASRLSPSARRLAEIVAVAGGDTTEELLIWLDLPDIDASLQECCSSGLLVRGDRGAVGFRHPLLLEASYLEMAPARRARLHDHVGRAIAERRPDAPERVARHVERAGRPGEAMEMFETAAHAARRAGNAGRAASLIQGALEVVHRHRALAHREEDLALTAIADLFRAGRWSELDPLVRARWTQRHVLEGQERAWLAGIFALHLFWTGSIGEADSVATSEIAHLEEGGQANAGAMLVAQAAFIAWFRGESERSLVLGRRALEVARGHGDTESECRARNALANAAFGFDRAREVAAEAHWENARFARAHGLAVAEANALWSASHFSPTVEAYEAVERAAERAGTWYGAPARVWKGMLHLVEGRPDDAEAIFVRVGSQIRLGVPVMTVWMDTVEAWLFLQRGDLHEASRLLQELPPVDETAHLAVWADQRSAAQGWLAWEEGRWGRAAEYLATAEQECRRGGYHLTVGGPILVPLHVDALLRLRRRTEAETVADSVARAHDFPDRFFRASLSATAFRLHPTGPAANEALRLADQAPWPWLAALILCWQGDLLRDRRAAHASRQRFEDLGAHAGVQRADAVLAALGGLATGRRDPHGSLSARELEVAALIAAGLTNPAIGRQLHLSRPTIASHVAHILTKLGFTSRSQVAAWFADQQAANRDQESST
ncbi:MAG: LuxR C-terminal-related transcriptional regulator, partial [Actinomycetota bacterium]|nr:LuxR C-terminal-related transcriptional regulator [Actinomycetota bacterium]